MDLGAKTRGELDRLIANHEAKGAVGVPFYRDLLEERVKRDQTVQKLNFDRSLSLLIAAARAQQCTTYGAVAAASDVEWAKARHQMDGAGGHLSRLSELCFARKLPFLTALCVSQADLASNDLRGPALSGFVACARRLGFLVTDETSFHRQQRDECWRWGRETTAE